MGVKRAAASGCGGTVRARKARERCGQLLARQTRVGERAARGITLGRPPAGAVGPSRSPEELHQFLFPEPSSAAFPAGQEGRAGFFL